MNESQQFSISKEPAPHSNHSVIEVWHGQSIGSEASVVVISTSAKVQSFLTQFSFNITNGFFCIEEANIEDYPIF